MTIKVQNANYSRNYGVQDVHLTLPPDFFLNLVFSRPVYVSCHIVFAAISKNLILHHYEIYHIVIHKNICTITNLVTKRWKNMHKFFYDMDNALPLKIILNGSFR